MRHTLDYHRTDLIFRLLFSLIFLGLGLEHLFSDETIREMMPAWIAHKRLVSMAAGVVLLSGGFSVLLGYRTSGGAVVLGAFLLAVTLTVHVPAVFHRPDHLPHAWHWLWDVYQRSNLVKNLCLLGVCFHLINHEPGKYSLDYRRNHSGKTSKNFET